MNQEFRGIFQSVDNVVVTLEMRLRCRLVASAGTIRQSLSYSCCWSRRIDALRYLRHTLRPATVRRPPTGADPTALDRARCGWSRAAGDPKLDGDRRGRIPILPTARRRTSGPGRPNFCRNICKIEHQYRYRLIIEFRPSRKLFAYGM